MNDNRTTELVMAATLLVEFLCEYQSLLLSHRLDANASEVVCKKQNELIDEYAERIVQAMAATLGERDAR